MTARPLPPHYDDLDAIGPAAWGLLGRGVADRRSPFHHPTIATTGLDGRPRLRTVVLRGCDPAACSLRFHTDVRSAKVAELRQDDRIAFHGYDPAAKIQIRVEGRATLHVDDGVARDCWLGSRAMSRICYGTSPAPGSVIPTSGGFTLPDAGNADAGAAHFCAVVVTVQSLEWLYLAFEGHRRALLQWRGAERSQEWLAP